MDPGLPIENVTNPTRECWPSIFFTFCGKPCEIKGVSLGFATGIHDRFSTKTKRFQQIICIHFPIVTTSLTFNISNSVTSQDRYISDLKEHGINIKCDALSMLHDTFIKNCSWRRQSCNDRYNTIDIRVFSKLPKLALQLYWQFCITSNGNILEIVANQMNLNTNLDFSRAYWIETNETGNYF